MKIYIQGLLVLLLLSLLYVKPSYISHMKHNILGKLVLVALLVFITHNYGLETGILFALIYLLILHTSHEGMENSSDEEEKEHDKEKDEEEKSHDEEHEDEEEEEEKPQETTSINQVDLDDEMRRPKKAGEPVETETTEEPVAISTSKVENFATLY